MDFAHFTLLLRARSAKKIHPESAVYDCSCAWARGQVALKSNSMGGYKGIEKEGLSPVYTDVIRPMVTMHQVHGKGLDVSLFLVQKQLIFQGAWFLKFLCNKKTLKQLSLHTELGLLQLSLLNSTCGIGSKDVETVTTNRFK